MDYHYPLMDPPMGAISFSEMTKQQAQEYFNWYVQEIPARINILMGAIEASGVQNMKQFDLTPASLNLLWAWLKERIKIIPSSQEEMDELRNTLPSWVLEDVSDWELDMGTLALAVDVSMYFAEVFLRQYPQLKWGFKSKPKSSVSLNKPVVLGFKCGELHPPTIVVNLCRSYVKGKQDKNLLSLFEVWSKFI